ncbi:hypothetical protein QBC46DRAFT_411423 [Diplogelasinospora grovesii]|uniref:Uncharacterized protein n=1 Tax=Diplogelasinospora grovesii TaxID=303347 RepID=A0AAN6N2R2_9PEZI|nr:hypothetical protein QBC46DRAFT_411423 [Diplogelasinospora grovesii]
MQPNVAIAVILLLLTIFISLIIYGLFRLRRVAMYGKMADSETASSASSGDEVVEVIDEKRERRRTGGRWTGAAGPTPPRMGMPSMGWGRTARPGPPGGGFVGNRGVVDVSVGTRSSDS